MWQRWNQSTHIFEKSTDNGGSWTPLGLNASIITEGTLADARLSSNVPLKNVSNTFTIAQAITGTDNRFSLTSGNNVWTSLQATPNGTEINENTFFGGGIYNLPNGSYSSWIFRLSAISDGLSIYRAPAGSTAYVQLVKVDNAGAIYEGGRTTPMGRWIRWFPTMITWEGAAIALPNSTCYYMQIDKTVFWRVYLTSFTIPAVTQYVLITCPPVVATILDTPWFSNVTLYVPGVGNRVGLCQTDIYNRLIFSPDTNTTSANWPAGVAHIMGQGFLSIS